MATFILTVSVDNIGSVVSLFDTIRVYRSTTGNVADRVLFDSFSLTAGQKLYTWTDSAGASTYSSWFTYYNSSTLVESGFSDETAYVDSTYNFVPGVVPGFAFSNTTYPPEFSLSTDDGQVVEDIRLLIGDPKRVKRDYVDPSCGYENVSVDGGTYKFTEPPGWPLQVTLDSTEYTSLLEPSVAGYEFITFSGTTISTVSGVLDVWWESFRNSDTEIFRVYGNSVPPPWVSTTQFTVYAKKVTTAITLLESELRDLMGQTSGSFSLGGELSYNPDPAFRARKKDLDDLRKKLDNLLNDAVTGSFTGVRID